MLNSFNLKSLYTALALQSGYSQKVRLRKKEAGKPLCSQCRFNLSLTRGAEKKELKSPDWELILLCNDTFNDAVEDGPECFFDGLYKCRLLIKGLSRL